MEYIDVHAHLNLAAFKDDADAVVLRTLESGVHFINVGTQHKTSARAVEQLGRYPKGVYATVGLHPLHTAKSFFDPEEFDEDDREFVEHGEVFREEKYEEFVKNERVVAIGECGLDYYRNPTDEEKKRQIEAFEAQIAFANKVNKPLMLHIRSGSGGNAYREALGILKKQAKVKGNSHFFAGNLEDAKQFWNMGYSTSFTGVLTFTGDYHEVVRSAPNELIHAETDAPYVAPVPYRGTRNEPVYVKEVVEKMAQIRAFSTVAMAQQLKENAVNFFALT